MEDEFRARRWLRGGHQQTLAAFFLQRRLDLPGAEERLIEVEAGVKVLCHCHWQRNPANALTAIVAGKPVAHATTQAVGCFISDLVR